MSWAEDMGIDGYEPHYVSSNITEWTTAHGDTTKIHSLETSHIENIIKRIDAKKSVSGQSHKINNLLAELKRRDSGGKRILTAEEFKGSNYNQKESNYNQYVKEQL